MNFKSLHPNFKLPTKGSNAAGGYDLYMPEEGVADYKKTLIPLGFAAEVPNGYVALILPRSGAGAKHSIELTNTCGVIDADYRGEWMASIQVKPKAETAYGWDAGEKLLQFILVPVLSVEPTLVEQLSDTSRGTGGFGSTGK